MKSIILTSNVILASMVLLSCESGADKAQSQCESMYQIIINENDKHISYLSKNIKIKIDENRNNQNVIIYNSLTNDYLDYLSEIEAAIIKGGTAIFFDEYEYSSVGKEFEVKTKLYKSEIEKLSSSVNFKKRLNLLLNTNSIQIPDDPMILAENNENGRTVVGKVYAFYLDYYFRGFSISQSLAFINNKKRAILELENEFLLNFCK